MNKKYFCDIEYSKQQDIVVGDLINGCVIKEIKCMVNGKPTYASTFIVDTKLCKKTLKKNLP